MDSFTLQIIIDAQPKAVWSYLVKKENLTVWLCEDAKIEEQVGGAFELYWDESNPEINSTKGCKIINLISGKLLETDWKGPEQFANLMNNPPVTSLRIMLEEYNSSTKLTLTHKGWRQGEQWNHAITWHKHVWSNALQQLKSSIEAYRSD